MAHSATTSIVSDRIRLDYLDGLRGLAAVYVVLGHIYVALRFFGGPAPSPMILTTLSIFNIGQFGVDVFIVLSGYCLMLPVVRASGELRGGFWQFMQRRARRILPPYYAALGVFLLLIYVQNSAGLIQPPNTGHFRGDVILSHLLVVHNWSSFWIYAIDPPMWSVATEWQIYFLFALILLPLWRVCGNAVTIVVALIMGLTPHFLFHGFLDDAFPWFLGLFAMGMAAAAVNFSTLPRLRYLAQRAPWDSLTVFLYAGILGYCVFNRGWYGKHQWIADPIIGMATMCLLIACTRTLATGQRSVIASAALRVFASPLAVRLGVFSYSIYLVHYPLLELLYRLLRRTPLASSPDIFSMALLATFPILIGTSYLFHLAFERRFMPGHLQQKKTSPGPDSVASTGSPSPLPATSVAGKARYPSSGV